MQIRRLNSTDAERFWTIRLEASESEPRAFRETAEEHRKKTVRSVAEMLGDGGGTNFVLGAFDSSEQLVGTAGLYRDKGRPESGVVWGMYVAPQHRKSGIGEKLLRRLLEEIRANDSIREVRLTVAHGQQSARNLYLRCGFKVSDEKPTATCGGNRPEEQDNMILKLL